MGSSYHTYTRIHKYLCTNWSNTFGAVHNARGRGLLPAIPVTHVVRVEGHPLNTGAGNIGTHLAISFTNSLGCFSVGDPIPIDFPKVLCRISDRSPEVREKITMYFHSNTQLLMDALLVLRCSHYHRSADLEHINNYFIAAIKNDRLRVIYDNENRPAGVFTWTYLPPDREKAYMEKPSSILASDFESEDGTLWAIDFAAPFGFCRGIVRALRREFPKGTKFRIYRTEQNRFGWMIA